MNARLLRSCRRSFIGAVKTWRIEGVGKLQPVIISIKHGQVRFRCETAHGWGLFMLPRDRTQAKKALADLIGA